MRVPRVFQQRLIIAVPVAFILGALGLALVGIPLLVLLTLMRANHPLVASVAAAALMFWRMVVSPATGPQFDDMKIFVMVAAATGFAAAWFARSNLSFHRPERNAAQAGEVKR
jgi:hypothetical protein